MRPEPAGAPGPTLHGLRVTLRPVTDADRGPLRTILADPSVARWWGMTASPDEAVEKWLDADADTAAFAIEVDAAVVGSIQAVEEADPDYRHAGIDLFLAAEAQGHGHGPDAVRTLARYLFEVRGHHRLTIDPAATNARAIAAYERVGFRRVGVMRSYERGPDGTFHDGLLMELLRDELR